jgi:hypothetical protein
MRELGLVAGEIHADAFIFARFGGVVNDGEGRISQESGKFHEGVSAFHQLSVVQLKGRDGVPRSAGENR